jgi:hypothetical protein
MNNQMPGANLSLYTNNWPKARELPCGIADYFANRHTIVLFIINFLILELKVTLQPVFIYFFYLMI